jgi:hypothetical protein
MHTGGLLKTWIIKIAKTHKNRGPPPIFSHNPKYPPYPPPSREFENDCVCIHASVTERKYL